jgi:hypothetical protein
LISSKDVYEGVIKMEKMIGEDDIKQLEEEIDSAVDRLFVEKKIGLTDSLIMETTMKETPILEPSFSGVLEPTYSRMEKDVDLESPFQPAPSPPPFLKSIEEMETQLLSLEWEITKENLEKTKEEVLALRGILKEKPDITSVLNLMEKVLNHMIKNEENIRPPLIKFLLDSKETIKLLMRKEKDNEMSIYKQLSYAGIEARFACFEEFKEIKAIRPSLALSGVQDRIEKPIIGEKKIEDMLNKMNLFEERMLEIFIKIDQHLSKLGQAYRESITEGLSEKRPLSINVTVFKVDRRLFGIESEKVFKLFRVPDTFYEKYSNEQKIRLKDFEVKMIDLKKIFSIGGGDRKRDIKILTVKDNGEYKGIMVDQVLKRLSTHSEIGGRSGEYFLGMIHSTYQEQPVEIPILDLKKF